MLAGSPIAGAPVAGAFELITLPIGAVTTIGTAWLDEMLAEYWTGSTIHAYLLEDGTAFDPTVDMYLADIPLGDRLVGPEPLTGLANADGYFTADDVQMTLGSGDVAQWFAIVRVDGSEASSPIVGATDVFANDIPLNAKTGDGGVVEFDIQALGLGRI